MAILIVLFVLTVLAWAVGPAAMRYRLFRCYWRKCVLLVLLALAAWSYLDYRAWSAAHPQQHRPRTHNSSGAYWLGD